MTWWRQSIWRRPWDMAIFNTGFLNESIKNYRADELKMIWRPAVCLGKTVALGFTYKNKRKALRDRSSLFVIISNRSLRKSRLKKHTHAHMHIHTHTSWVKLNGCLLLRTCCRWAKWTMEKAPFEMPICGPIKDHWMMMLYFSFKTSF